MAYPKKDFKTVVIRVPEPLAVTFKAVAFVWEKAHSNRHENPWQQEGLEAELDYIAREGHCRADLIETYLQNYRSANRVRHGEKRSQQPRWQKVHQLLTNLEKLIAR
jgi:hypothetical protein